MNLPSWYPFAEEGKPAPMPLLLVQAFLNTRHFEDDSDLLSDPETARLWLAELSYCPEPQSDGGRTGRPAACARASAACSASRRGEAHGALALRPCANWPTRTVRA